ncbi:GUN4 domain-containing protein [Microcoleus sp. B5-D4]|uniref:nSTAND1 domain-containing NTPase n=1 Tax=unclassified Microcoleus TaxID=2642155 RepID=UPI002FD02817
MTKRQALVIGINEYPFGGNLPTAAQDAEKIAQLLEKYGSFEVHRLPSKEDVREVDSEKNLDLKELEDAITQLFQPKSGIIPETALLFFAGHGWRSEKDGQPEGFLMTSDALFEHDSEDGLFSLKRLHQILKDSLVRQQIVWLDCCHSGELFNFIEQNLAEFEQQRDFDRCFIAACREFQVAYGGVLTPALLKALDPTNKEESTVTNLSLKPLLEAALQNAPQHSVVRNIGSQIILTYKGGVRGNICPYKGLEYFDFNPTNPQKANDHRYFYGRTQLTNQLLEKVGSSNFIAVLGASGSGKSSVVRAGLLYQLYLGNQSPLKNKIPGSDGWTFYPPFTPGTDPLGNLQEVLGISVKTTDDLVLFIKRIPSERVVLVVDQFEEVFAPPNQEKRQKFFEYLMGAVEHLGNKLCLVLVMRDDFQHKCAEQEYAGLANKIDNNLVRVQRMNRPELQEVILKPAELVELEIDGNLVQRMIADVTDSPGDLALLQYTLNQLWENSSFNLLTISDYSRLGGVQKALGNHADTVYSSLLPEEQKAARRIFQELTRLSEDKNTPNTRQQVWLKDLVNSQQSEELINKVVQYLADAKLVVTSEQELEAQRVAVVNIVHETLIRNWGLLDGWLKEYGEALIIKQPIEDAAKEWRDKGKQRESAYLLQGTKLAVAEEYIKRYSDLVPLSGSTQEFVQKSIKNRKKNRRNLALAVSAVVVGLAGLAGWALIENADAQIRADSASSKSLIDADRKLEGLVASLRAAKRLKEPFGGIGAKTDTRIEAITALQKSVYGIAELNRFESDTGEVKDVSISPDGQLIASASKGGTVKIWDKNGKLISTWSRNLAENETKSIWSQISSINFSPDSQLIAFADHQNILLMDRSGKIVRTLKYQEDEMPLSLAEFGIGSVSFSPDGQMIASGGGDDEIRLQTLEGKLIAVLKHTNDSGDPNIMNISFSSDNQMIASADMDGEIRLWSRDGKLFKKINHSNKPPVDRKTVFSVAFSPDSQTFVSAGDDGIVRLWKKNGTLVTNFSGHKDGVTSVAFSANGKLIATASKDNTIKIWKISGKLLTTITGHSGAINKVNFTPDGQKLVTASDDGTVRVWQISPIDISRLKGHSSSVTDVEFSPDGQMIATASEDRTVKLWSRDGRMFKTLIGHSDKVNSVSFSPDNQIIASVDNFGKFFRLWKRNGTPINSYAEDSTSSYNTIKFSPKGQIIASTGWFGMELWDYQGKLIRTIQDVDGAFHSVSFSPDGQVIASYVTPRSRMYNEGPSLKLWEINGKLLTKLLGNKASFRPDGKEIVTSGEDGILRIYKNNGSLIANLTGGHSKKVTDLSFSPDGQMIASASEDGTVKLWSHNGTLVETLNLTEAINSLSFSPDGKELATAVSDGTVILWNLDIEDLQKRGCAWVRGYLENNQKVSNEDRHLCDGVPDPKSKTDKISSEKKSSTQNKVTGSPLAQIELPSQVGANYSLLRDLLAKRELKAADQETLNIMRWIAYRNQNGLTWEKRYEIQGGINEKSIKEFPCTELQTINKLWLKESNGHFGFSIQKQTYEKVGQDFDKLKVSIGWFREQETFTEGRRIPYSEYTFNLNAPKGHLPASDPALSGSGADWSGFMGRLKQCGL